MAKLWARVGYPVYLTQGIRVCESRPFHLGEINIHTDRHGSLYA